MSKETQSPNRRKSLWLLGLIVLLLLTFLILLQSSNLWKSLSVESAGDALTLYALSALNFIAFIIFAFILGRNLVKLLRERRTLQLGAKIKTRLLLYFAAVSILPIIAMSGFSYLYLNRALDRWLSQIPEDAITKSKKAQSQNILDNKQRMAEAARMLAQAIGDREIEPGALKEILQKGEMAHIEIIDADGEPLLIAESDNARKNGDEIKGIINALRARRFEDPVLFGGRGIEAAYADFPDGRKLIIIPEERPNTQLNILADKSLNEFDRLKNEQYSIRQIGLSTLGVLTFLLIFASSWAAFYIARGITIPIKALAEGSNEIAQGNFSHRVDVFAEDELELLVGSFNQMSARLEANSDELKEGRRYIETILEALPIGVISFDSDDKITTINRAAVRMFRLEDLRFEGFFLDQLLKEENRAILDKLMSRAKRIGQASEQTVLMREHSDGSSSENESMPVALTASALPDSNGVVLMIEDLTELINAQRASAWQEVARRMAHEIKNPLTPIQLSAERIAKRFDSRKNLNGDNEKISGGNRSGPSESEQLTKLVNESTSTIIREVGALKSMVDEFSKFARMPNVKLEQGDINEPIRQAALLFEDRGVKIKTSLSAHNSHLLLDAEQIKRVFVNLIENALEAFDQDQEDKSITITSIKAKSSVVIEVMDNANGVLPQDFPKLFQPYFSTKGRGSGLGLAIVQRIIAEHGGKIRAQSNQPKGTKFIVELPLN